MLTFFLPRCTACGILVPWPGTEPAPVALTTQSSNHWRTCGEAPPSLLVGTPVLLDPGPPHWPHFIFTEIWRNTVLPTAPPQGSCVFTQTGSQGLTCWSRNHSERCQPQGAECSLPSSPKGPRWAFPCITLSCPGWSPRCAWPFL